MVTLVVMTAVLLEFMKARNVFLEFMKAWNVIQEFRRRPVVGGCQQIILESSFASDTCLYFYHHCPSSHLPSLEQKYLMPEPLFE